MTDIAPIVKNTIKGSSSEKYAVQKTHTGYWIIKNWITCWLADHVGSWMAVSLSCRFINFCASPGNKKALILRISAIFMKSFILILFFIFKSADCSVQLSLGCKGNSIEQNKYNDWKSCMNETKLQICQRLTFDYKGKKFVHAGEKYANKITVD